MVAIDILRAIRLMFSPLLYRIIFQFLFSIYTAAPCLKSLLSCFYDICPLLSGVRRDHVACLFRGKRTLLFGYTRSILDSPSHSENWCTFLVSCCC